MQAIDFKQLLFSQKKIVKLLAINQSLSSCLDAICLELESLLDTSGITASILLVKNNHLYFGGGPNVSREYSNAIDELKIGPNVGSCGTAAFNAVPFYVEDISQSPEWANFKEVPKKQNFVACWSTPVMSSSQHVIGTFGVYSNKACLPTQAQIDIISFFINLTSLAIEKELAKNREIILNKQLNHTLNRMQAFGRVMPDVGFIISEDGYYVDVYGGQDLLMFQPVGDLIGKKIRDVLPKDVSDQVLSVVDKTLKMNSKQICEYQLTVPKGKLYFEGKTAPIENYNEEEKTKRHVVWLTRDITNRKTNEMKIEKLAFYDSLTKLPNRRLLMDRLQTAIKKIKRNKLQGALIFLDLDNFKHINDTNGHSGGDHILCEVAKKLNKKLRDSDTLARIGGDEFVILIEGDASKSNVGIIEETTHVCERILRSLKRPIIINDMAINIGASLGVTIIEGDNITADGVLHKADAAMYEAKNSGKGKLQFFKDTNIDSINK